MILWNPLSPFFLQLEAKKLYEYGKQKKYGEKMSVSLQLDDECSNLKMFQLELWSYTNNLKLKLELKLKIKTTWNFSRLLLKLWKLETKIKAAIRWKNK
jgi:hypothetical protein